MHIITDKVDSVFFIRISTYSEIISVHLDIVYYEVILVAYVDGVCTIDLVSLEYRCSAGDQSAAGSSIDCSCPEICSAGDDVDGVGVHDEWIAYRRDI